MIKKTLSSVVNIIFVTYEFRSVSFSLFFLLCFSPPVPHNNLQDVSIPFGIFDVQNNNVYLYRPGSMAMMCLFSFSFIFAFGVCYFCLKHSTNIIYDVPVLIAHISASIIHSFISFTIYTSNMDPC